MMLAWSLSDVCLSRSSGLSREQRGLGRLFRRGISSHNLRYTNFWMADAANTRAGTGLPSPTVLERTYSAQRFSFLVIFLSFYFGSCGRLSWLNCCFRANVNIGSSYQIPGNHTVFSAPFINFSARTTSFDVWICLTSIACHAAVTTTIRLRFDGHSTAYQRSLRSQWRNPVAAVTLTLVCLFIMPAPRVGALSDDARLTSVWRLSVAFIGPKSRTERPRKTKILAQR